MLMNLKFWSSLDYECAYQLRTKYCFEASNYKIFRQGEDLRPL
jgi:hypothetical protein